MISAYPKKAIYDIGTKILSLKKRKKISQKNHTLHWYQDSFFSFDEPLLDAESVLEDVLDTNITNFLRRF